MPHKPEMALLVSTYERPHHLRRALASIALQKHVEGKFEVVITDDGSKDETADIVKKFARRVDFPVHFTTHPHDGFRLARCRNEGVARTAAEYLVFLDGDCVIPPDYLYQHYKHRRPKVARTGGCVILDRPTSERIDEAAIRSGEFMKCVRWSERKKIANERLKALFYHLTRNRERPKLFAGTASMWREDYERINGYDENFRGWGCEDDDLRRRLTRAGVWVKSILLYTYSYHLWHPTVPSFPKSWREGENVNYLTRGIRFTRCRNGLRKLAPDDLAVQMVGQPARADLAAKLLPRSLFNNAKTAVPEIEILVLPGRGAFSGKADCNILVVLEDVHVDQNLAQQAQIVLTKPAHIKPMAKNWRPFDELNDVLCAVA